MNERLFRSPLPVAVSALHAPAHVADVAPGAPQGAVVAELFEDRDRVLGELEQLVCPMGWISEELGVCELDFRPQGDSRVARVGGNRLGERRLGNLELARPPLCDAELAQELARSSLSTGNSATARPSRFTVAGVSARFQARMPAAASRSPAQDASRPSSGSLGRSSRRYRCACSAW